MPIRQKDLIGGLSRREAEKAVLMLRCLHPEILTQPPRKLFDIKQWSAICGFSKKNHFQVAHSNWWSLRKKILELQLDDSDANGATSNDQEDDSVCSTSSAEIIVATRSENSEGKGKGKSKSMAKATELTNSAAQDVDDDDSELVANSNPMVERVIEIVDLEPIEIKDEDQFELDWRSLELHQKRSDSRDPE